MSTLLHHNWNFYIIKNEYFLYKNTSIIIIMIIVNIIIIIVDIIIIANIIIIITAIIIITIIIIIIYMIIISTIRYLISPILSFFLSISYFDSKSRKFASRKRICDRIFRADPGTRTEFQWCKSRHWKIKGCFKRNIRCDR